MRYLFKILVLSANTDASLIYTSKFFNEEGVDNRTYYEWFKEMHVLEDVCDLEVDVITDMINANFEELIPSVDGIIYFVNPLKKDESDLFEMILPIISSVKRDIPTIIMFFDPDGILPISVNDLLESIWINHPDLEAFVNLPPRDFHQVIQCLCLAMINGESPLNIENAWMRFPIFLQMANIYHEKSNIFYAAKAAEKVALISEIFNREETYIFSELTANLYAQINLFLEASKNVEKVDRKKYKNYKKSYVQAMILEGNKLFNNKEYKLAAKKYESAAQWAFIELKDKNMVVTSFKLAINSWISACDCKNAFDLLQRLPHDEVNSTLNDIAEKIKAGADYLLSIDNFELAKIQLYMSITIYQREGLFDQVKEFAKKLAAVLSIIFEKQIQDKESNLAYSTYSEIENLWDNYDVEKIDADIFLEKLIKLTIEDLNFSRASDLINKLESLDLKQQLTAFNIDAEEAHQRSKKKEFQEIIKKGVLILNEFVELEEKIINDLNSQKIEEAKEYINQGNYFNAAYHLKNQVIYLLSLGKKDLAENLLFKVLDYLVEGKLFEDFFNNLNELSKKTKKVYLEQYFSEYFEKLNEIEFKGNFGRIKAIFEKSNTIYRDQMLYGESKQISLIYIKKIKDEALRIVEGNETLSGINQALDLLREALNTSSSYLDKPEQEKITFNRIYKKIAEIYITLGDLSSAQAYNDKIKNKEYKNAVHKKIAESEAEKRKIRTEKIKETLKGKDLEEKLSIIKNKGLDALHDRGRDLKQRKALKRAYFQEALDYIKKKEFVKAIEKYKESMARLIKAKKYNLAGVSLAFTSLLLLNENKLSEIKKLLRDTKNELSSLGRLFSEAFSVSLIEYIVDIKDLKGEINLKEAFSFFENFPLFEEELSFLYEYFLDKDIIKEEVVKDLLSDDTKVEDIKSELEKMASEIKKERSDVAKRRLMRKQYWNAAIDELIHNKLRNASKIYLEAVPKLVDKNLIKHAAIGLILGSIVMLKESDIREVRLTFNSTLKSLKENKERIEQLPEIEIMRSIFEAFEVNSEELIELCKEILIDKLILFEQEIEFIQQLLSDKKV